LAAVKGITLAFGVLATVSRFAFLGILGNLIAMVPATGAATVGISGLRVAIYRKVIALRASNAASVGFITAMKSKLKEIPKLIGALRMLGGAWLTATWPILLIVAAIALVAGAFYMMYKNSEDLRKAVSELGKALKDQLAASWELIRNALQKIMPEIENVSDIFKKMGDWIAKYVMPPLKIWYTFLIKLATFFVVYFIGYLTIFINYIKGFVGLWIGLFQAIRTGSLDPLKTAFENFVNGIIDGVNTMIDALNVLNPFKDIPYIEYVGDAKKATDDLKKSTDPLIVAQEEASKKIAETAASAANLYTEFGDLKTIQATVRTEIENTFDKVTGGARALINARDAAKAFKEETDRLTTTLKDGSLSVGQKEDSLYAYGASVLDAIKKDIELGGTQASTTKIMEDGRKPFLDGADAIGMGATEAGRLADKLGLTPATIKKTFEVSGLKSLQELTAQLGELEKLTTGSRSTIEGKTGEFKDIRKEVIEVKAKIDQQMTVKFGKRSGQDASSALFVNVNGKALGGPVNSREGYLVGEKGPELFQPDSNGTIIPNNKLGAMGSGPTIIVNPSQGMDEVELAHSVSRQLAWSMRRGV
jgi:hypothetical protein